MVVPKNPEDAARWAHTRLRMNIIDDVWEIEAVDYLREKFSLQNVLNIGRPSTSINLFSTVVNQIAIQYDSTSKVDAPGLDGPSGEAWASLTESCHLWPILKDNGKKVIALRENFVGVTLTSDGIQLELVPPCEVVIDSTSGDRSKPTALRRARCYPTVGKDGKPTNVDAWECYDISNPEDPKYWIETDGRENITASIDPKYETYRWIDEEGPFIPYQFYRAQITSQTWDPYAMSAIVSGTLDVAVEWSMWGVCARNNSYPQWYTIDLEVPGTGIADASKNTSRPAATIDLAPNSVLQLVSKDAQKTGSIGQLEASDLLTMARAILLKQNTILSNIGIHPDDVTTSAPEAGVAISLKRSVQRKIALSYIPTLRMGDTGLFRLMARVWNLYYAGDGVPALPTEGWTIDYQLPEASTDEFLADLEKDKGLISIGLKSTVDVARKLYNLSSDEEAIERLREIRKHNQMFPLDGSAPTIVEDSTP